MLPRLSGIGTQLSRLGAGIGTRGPGETKLETDRRHIRRRIGHLQEELREIKNHRELLRRRREKDNTQVCALVGYTNAGKSTILNALTDASVLAEDKLFATLDPTIRAITLDDGREPMLVDTVGFIRKLPHHLIEAFKSTLEEAVFADLLIIVIDSSSDEYEQHIRVVNGILKDIGAEAKPRIYLFNKIDEKPQDLVLPSDIADADAVLEISAKSGEGLSKFREVLGEVLPGKKQRVRVLIPYDKGSVLSVLHREQTVLSESYEAEGTLVEAFVDAQGYALVRDYLRD
jgi:GTP-binding protein HflX